ncbi:copper homeostasis protein CutC [Terrimonas sp. NA20]|uniref:PF03932 family protein CutC n=1 Tax=Terrimonas ginsenosidimutans TaxID=2908004 RepID=A0ABS9KXS5_9BACT|nr:copper homeostasis protein CutC [Terrimonas ginsenosidimutans]MCG2617034.1 copper homeostasis protein CutC [Terrimonas ginsenosidimutans]
MSYLIEIATSDFVTTQSAVKGGADRIELCANLAEGGTTPSAGTIRQCREAFDVQLYPIIRPRGGDFLYTPEEFEIMLHDVKLSREFGCDGVVIGMLGANGDIDVSQTSKLVEAAYPLGVTFHRAFDRCVDPFKALEQLIGIGCERILTSGQKPGAPEGVELIAELNKAADHRIIIMPGSGVRVDNVRWLSEQTGCTELHSSLRRKTRSRMEFVHPGFASSEESYMNNAIDEEEVRQLKKALLKE